MSTAAQRGTTTIADRAVRRIAERAADEALAERTSRAAVSVQGHRARVALDVALPYPAPLSESVRSLQEHVAGRTQELTGLDVPTARVRVTSLTPLAGADEGTGEHGPSPAAPPAPEAGADGEAAERRPAAAARTPRRLWSRRRVPVAVLAALGAAVCGALALDLVMVHAAHRPAAAWRVDAVHWLSEHGPGDRPVVVAGGLMALLGVWMIVLAVTPGLRRRTTLRSPGPRVVAAVDRSAVEALTRDAVGEVAGVGEVRVRVRRRRVSVRAALLFGERAAVRADVTAAAGRALASCGLCTPLRTRVRLTPAAVWRPPAADGETAQRPAGSVPGPGPEGEA
ncbi:DUF6286 domain-containing Asp23/Gls24 family envelope stress response protein [Streptomyces heilongjiangensis]|uniref:DUF6286 domain-containing Asp23/Gls24 family envelope stress response protein n=1 Tax=Streptomyces heilongjiangensis TaxID=945052 RepID=A0ABW1BBC0_9ACTN|nr:DUF6286 domain-containing protein [Streptomyces heilongjiangensis]MDC2946296.1 DUF6286 domain-containing protein [Streptomyces heilongjiangensis]